jgi:presenilin-like A22 family membrane protease
VLAKPESSGDIRPAVVIATAEPDTMTDFSPLTAAIIFVTYVAVDILYAYYIICVERRRALAAAVVSSVLYSLLAYGVITYSQNPIYIVPLASGAFVGTFLTVRFHAQQGR